VVATSQTLGRRRCIAIAIEALRCMTGRDLPVRDSELASESGSFHLHVSPRLHARVSKARHRDGRTESGEHERER
jgi:hypothetical protein